MREETEFIVVHCSATPPSMDIGVAEIRQWHMESGWSDIGYARVVRRDGTAEDGRDLDPDAPGYNEIGAHVLGYNYLSVGICLVGGVDEDGVPEDNFTSEQMESLRRELHFCKILFPKADIVGHNDLDKNKACPCFDLKTWLSTVKI